jgi:ABC-type branched-subunit amino acid transport system substrate-binding protein
LFTGVVAQTPLTSQERRGKQIYVRGESPSGGDIRAYLGSESMEVPSSVLPCAGCHGLSGVGKPEGGVDPSNITWEALTKPYGVVHTNGRKHPAYTEKALELAVTRGLDPAGNKLLTAMPRYEMKREDLADLIAYLRRLGTDREPGVTEQSLTIGSVLPVRGALTATAQAVKAATEAFFAEINSHGGIYNRKIEVKFAETGDTADAPNAQVKRFIDEQEIFAMTSAFIAGFEKEFANLMQSSEVPVVGPFTLLPQTGHPLNRYVFYLLPGVAEQARALVNFAARQSSPSEKPLIAMINSEQGLTAGLTQAITESSAKNVMSEPRIISYDSSRFDAATHARSLSEARVNTVIFLGKGDDALALMKEAEKLGWAPKVYVLGVMTGKEVLEAPMSFNKGVFLSFPTVPSDLTAEGRAEFQALAAKHRLPTVHVAAQLSAFAAAKILVEGLKRSGRDVTREKLIATLEGMNSYVTGVTPPITYGANRRVGAMGAYIVTVDLAKKEYVPIGSWVDAN